MLLILIFLMVIFSLYFFHFLSLESIGEAKFTQYHMALYLGNILTPRCKNIFR